MLWACCWQSCSHEVCCEQPRSGLCVREECGWSAISQLTCENKKAFLGLPFISGALDGESCSCEFGWESSPPALRRGKQELSGGTSSRVSAEGKGASSMQGATSSASVHAITLKIPSVICLLCLLHNQLFAKSYETPVPWIFLEIRDVMTTVVRRPWLLLSPAGINQDTCCTAWALANLARISGISLEGFGCDLSDDIHLRCSLAAECLLLLRGLGWRVSRFVAEPKDETRKLLEFH